jgi:uncharacterized protein YxeA
MKNIPLILIIVVFIISWSTLLWWANIETIGDNLHNCQQKSINQNESTQTSAPDTLSVFNTDSVP